MKNVYSFYIATKHKVRNKGIITPKAFYGTVRAMTLVVL